MNRIELARLLDHSLLKPEATEEERNKGLTPKLRGAGQVPRRASSRMRMARVRLKIPQEQNRVM